MFRMLFYLLIFYLIWKLIEPYLKNLFTTNPEIKGNSDQKNIKINPEDIEDASFKEIDDSKS